MVSLKIILINAWAIAVMEIVLKSVDEGKNGQNKIACASRIMKGSHQKCVCLFVVEIRLEEDLIVYAEKDFKKIVEDNANLSIMIAETIKY